MMAQESQTLEEIMPQEINSVSHENDIVGKLLEISFQWYVEI